MTGATPSHNVTIRKDGGGSQTYSTTLSNNGITAPGATITGGNGAIGSMPVTLQNNANGSASTGAKTWTVDISPVTGGGDGRVDVSATILSQRAVSVNESLPVNFGSLLRNASVSTVLNLSTTGDDNNRTRVTVGGTVAADGNGISVSTATGTSFNSAASTGTRTLSGTFTSYGSSVTGSRNLSVTTAEAAGVGDIAPYSPISITYSALVGNATADKSNSMTVFGTPLTASVAIAQSYANLESRVFSTIGAGGGPALSSVATILEGTNSSGSDNKVNMAWRTRTQGETSIGEGGSPSYPPLSTSSHLISDVVKITDNVNNGGAALGQSDQYVLQMTYDPTLIPGNESLLASLGRIGLSWLDTNDPAPGGKWHNAVTGNTGFTTVGNPVLASFANYKTGLLGSHGAKPGNTTVLGDWGVDTTNNVAWSVINYGNAQFAVVPEPSTLLLGIMGFGLLLGLSARRRKQSGA